MAIIRRQQRWDPARSYWSPLDSGSSAVTAALSATLVPSRDYGNSYLLPFDSEVGAHIKDWCANVDEIITTIGILKGRPKTWANTWSLQYTTWEQVKQDLIQTFGEEFRYADDVQWWRDCTLEQASSHAVYATKVWTLFKWVQLEATAGEVIDSLVTGIYPDFMKCVL